ncbi:hypothetical protein ACKU27_20640 [Sphingobium yanoikuyae]|uniref:hypothetical protein n=1 Tax=Sphingobium yanoikuyae TaxID=13690 RepID=UPI003B9015DD
MNDEQSVPTGKVTKSRNWWKIGFFVALFAFEVTREIAVLEASAEIQPNTMYHLYNSSELVSAEGSWKRIDGGGKLIGSSVKIECWSEKGICLEAYANARDGFVYAPNIDWFDANFTREAVTYENTVPECASYSVRIDLKMKKVFAVRDKKPDAKGELCGPLEQRVEMQLADGYESKTEPLKGHFVPVLSVLATIIRSFEK